MSSSRRPSPLPRVHYGLIAQGRAAVHLAIDFQKLGIVTTADEFDNQPLYWPTFRARLTAMGLPADLDPRATEVLFPSVDAIKSFIARHPEIDFLVPDHLVPLTREHVTSSAGIRVQFVVCDPNRHAGINSAPTLFLVMQNLNRAIRYLWAAPTTALGIVIAAAALLTSGTVYLLNGVIEAHGGFAAFFLKHITGLGLKGGAAALTLGHVVIWPRSRRSG